MFIVAVASLTMRKILALLALLFVSLNASGQHMLLMLEKQNRQKTAYYEVGDELTFYRQGKRARIQDQILAFEDSTIVFRGYQVHVNEITALHIDDKTRWWLRFKAAQLLLIGGTGYLLIDTINNREFSKGTLVTGGAMIGLGLVFRLLIPNKIKIKGRTNLRILKL